MLPKLSCAYGLKNFKILRRVYHPPTPTRVLRKALSIKVPIDDGAGQWPVGVGLGRLSPGYNGIHDVGGIKSLLEESIDTSEKSLQLWEKKMHAVLVLLSGKGLMNVDGLRRSIEQLHPAHYTGWSYYEKWAAAIAQNLLESKVLSREILLGLDDEESVQPTTIGKPSFRPGQTVRVKTEDIMNRWKKPHLRTPGYIFGAVGTVERYCGMFGDPEHLAYQTLGKGTSTKDTELVPSKQHLYRIQFRQADLWEGYDSNWKDSVDVEIYESWLEDYDENVDEGFSQVSLNRDVISSTVACEHTECHGHFHTHDSQHHLSRHETEQKAIDEEGFETPGQKLSKYLCNALIEEGVLTLSEIHRTIETIEMTGTNFEGNRIVARAWKDDEFKKLLLKDARSACEMLGLSATNSTTASVLTVLENTEKVHNLIVCSLCSCYPLSILGLSPPWYKSRAYRAQAIRKPRQMLKETFGLEIDGSVQIKVHDSTADLRYLVLPKQPQGTEDWSEEKLQSIVTRDCLIGVAVPNKET